MNLARELVAELLAIAIRFSGYEPISPSDVPEIIPIPDTLPFTDAVPGVWLTALYGIVQLGRLRQADSVLIHAAAGAIGQAAIQLAQNAGADIFVTVSSTAKKALLQNQYGIPDNRFFSSRRMAFGKQILRATGGRNVDVILNSSSGEQLAETWRCIAPLGRFVEIGKRDIYSFQKLSMYPFSRNATFAALDLQAIYQKHLSVIAELNKELRMGMVIELLAVFFSDEGAMELLREASEMDVLAVALDRSRAERATNPNEGGRMNEMSKEC